MTRTRKLVALLVAVAGIYATVAVADTTRVPSLGVTIAQIVAATTSWTGGVQTFSDEVLKVCDNGDTTKCSELELTGLTTGNTAPITLAGTAASPLIRMGAGTAGAPTYSILGVTDQGMYSAGATILGFASQATPMLGVTGTEVRVHPSGCLGFSSATITAANDSCTSRAAAGVIRDTDSVGTTPTWHQHSAARISLASDYTDTDATVGNTTLSLTLKARKYSFKMALFHSNSTAADGIRVDFNGGTATVTDFRVHCLVHDTALLLSQQSTALDTDIVATTTTGASQMDCNGTFEVAVAGTFIVRAAEEADGGGTLTVEQGSWLWFEDMP